MNTPIVLSESTTLRLLCLLCWSCGALLVLLFSGCASAPDSTVPGPLAAAPLPRPANVERARTGAIYQAGMSADTLYTRDKKPHQIGDTLKVEIAESLSASHKASTTTSGDRAMASKGPGSNSGNKLLSSILNQDASAAGSNSFKGDGSTDNSSKFSAQVAATVINVLPNGNLVVAGDRSIALNGGVSVLRFSGIVNPRDIKAGNVVASSDAVNAKVEVVGRGEVSDAAQRSWIQRVLSDSLSFW